MSEFHVEVVRVGRIEEHPNADMLEVTRVYDYPVIVRKGDFKEGDLAVYVPVDSVVPDRPEWAFFQGHRRIKAKKLRGIYSQGLLVHTPEGAWRVGTDVREFMGIDKYEPPLSMITGGECERGPTDWTFPTYTDIEGLRRYPNVLEPGEPVIMAEKIHGINARFCHDGERLWVGSHHQVKRDDPKSVYWIAARNAELEERLAKAPMKVFFGEVYGQVQDLKYGIKSGVAVRFFDVFDVKEGRYLDFEDAFKQAVKLELRWVPVLYGGEWRYELAEEHAEGRSTLADHVREGTVIRPFKERYNDEIGRVILKRHGEGYLLRKKG